MEVQASNLSEYLGRPFIYRTFRDNAELLVEGTTVYISRTGSPDDGVGDITVGYFDKNGDQRDFYVESTDTFQILT